MVPDILHAEFAVFVVHVCAILSANVFKGTAVKFGMLDPKKKL